MVGIGDGLHKYSIIRLVVIRDTYKFPCQLNTVLGPGKKDQMSGRLMSLYGVTLCGNIVRDIDGVATLGTTSC